MRIQPLRLFRPRVVEDLPARDLHAVHRAAPRPAVIGLVVGGQQRNAPVLPAADPRLALRQVLVPRLHAPRLSGIPRLKILHRVIAHLKERAPLLQILAQRVRQDRPRVVGGHLRLALTHLDLAVPHAQPRPALAQPDIDLLKVHPLQHRPVQRRHLLRAPLVLAPPRQKYRLRHHLHRVRQLLPVRRVEHRRARLRPAPAAAPRAPQRLFQIQSLVPRVLFPQQTAPLPEFPV